MQDAVGIGIFVEANCAALGEQRFHHLLRFGFRSVAPDDPLRPRLLSSFFYPLFEGSSQGLSDPFLPECVMKLVTGRACSLQVVPVISIGTPEGLAKLLGPAKSYHPARKQF